MSAFADDIKRCMFDFFEQWGVPRRLWDELLAGRPTGPGKTIFGIAPEMKRMAYDLMSSEEKKTFAKRHRSAMSKQMEDSR